MESKNPHELIPPPDPNWVFRNAVIGLACVGVASLIGGVFMLSGGDQPGLASAARLLLCAVGMLLIGSAASLSPGLWKVWAIAAVAAVLAGVVGLPTHWDSARLLTRVVAALCLFATMLTAIPVQYRIAVGSLLAMIHFGGILTATTMPEPGPWLSNQAFNRVYSPYLTFIYFRNAYHFYSPEPGPASLIYVLVHYEIPGAPDDQKHKYVWEEIPRRDTHMKDPLGLSYYRRLSLTEMLASSITAMNTPQSPEKEEAARLRNNASFGLGGKERIPLAPAEVMPAFSQYRIPYPHITRYIMPSYARHLAAELSGPDRKVVGMKFYRVEHRVLTTASFAYDQDPFDPITYQPYFYGEYDASGTLVDPQDPMLYWLVPILPKLGGPSPTDEEQVHFDDYMSKHAGYKFVWRRR